MTKSDLNNFMEQFLNNPLFKYQDLLINHLTSIYQARKLTERKDWNRFSDLLIDKFAIHSSSLFHMLYGFIEEKDSAKEERKVRIDLFSIYSLMRVIIETYVAFNHIFVFPKNEEEGKFKFNLWKLDGFIQKRKFRVDPSDFEQAEPMLESDLTVMPGTSSGNFRLAIL